MPLLRTIVFAAALAGLLAGLFVTLAQRVGTVPLIVAAEALEQAPAAEGGHDHPEAWAPRDGLERTLFTLVANLVTGTGFALLLCAAFGLRGRTVGWREGLFWGLGGFAAFSLAPFLGLPPELPGMAAAPLGPRQAWWLATALATAAGLALLALSPKPLSAVLGVALLVAPHLVGAPPPAEAAAGAVPESLARSFVVAVTVTSFLFWVVLGVLSALIFDRLAKPASAGWARAILGVLGR
jgi:cobalt transporter subunit CbtA